MFNRRTYLPCVFPPRLTAENDATIYVHAVFHVDQPFLYLITEVSTGAVLFAGCYGLRD